MGSASLCIVYFLNRSEWAKDLHREYNILMFIHASANDIDLLKRGVTKLLYEVFPTNNSLYLLGSGVSAQHSKMESVLVQSIVDKYYLGGSFFIEDQAGSSLAANLLWRYMAFHDDVFLKELSRKIPDGFIKTIINEEYAQLSPLNDNPEYQIFLSAKRGSTIIDMNYEGFSVQNLRNHHFVIPMHGLANPELAKYTRNIRRDIVMWDLDMSKHSEIKRYPGEKQTKKIIAPHELHLINKVFPKLMWLVIIGYSFANTGNGLNDLALYDLIKEYVKYYKKIQIIIINPKPEPVVVLFESELDRTTIIPAYWNSLTRAIKTNRLILHKNYLQDILRDYYRFLVG